MSEFKKYVLTKTIDDFQVVIAQIKVKEPPQNPNYRKADNFLIEKANKIIVYENGKCKYIDNLRGTKFWLPGSKHGSEAREITELGETPPPNALYEAPAKNEEDLENDKVLEAENELAEKLNQELEKKGMTQTELLIELGKKTGVFDNSFENNIKAIKQKLKKAKTRLSVIKARHNRED